MKLKFCALAILTLFVVRSSALPAKPNLGTNVFNLEQIRQIIRSNLTGSTEAELDRYALEGLLQGLRGKVKLLNENEPASGSHSNLSRATVYESGVGYLRVHTVSIGLADEIAAAAESIAQTNQLKGLVLDLRFAEGDDYLAATTTANLFVTDERDLLDWGTGMMKSTAKTNALSYPVAVLINLETTGAPEALAAVLRETGVALLLGNATRGAAMTGREFLLADGQRLRIATMPVKMAGDTIVPASGVAPDIQVNVSTAEELAYFSDPYAAIPKSATTTNLVASTNRVIRRTRTSEADLVRARKQGVNLDEDEAPVREVVSDPQLIRDPALARAIDLLKGLAVIRRNSR